MSTRNHTHHVQSALEGLGALSLIRELNALPWSHFDELTLAMGAVPRVDASGVVALVRLYSQLRTQGIQMRLSRVRPPVADELHRLGIDTVIGVSRAPIRSLPPSRPVISAL